jgi:hypothetical protein
VAQALDHLLAVRHRGAAEGRHAKPAALRALPQPRPGLLETVRGLPGDLAHEALDTLPPGRTLVHLRSMLVAAGALPARDERLVALERWIGQVIAGRTSPEHRRACTVTQSGTSCAVCAA